MPMARLTKSSIRLCWKKSICPGSKPKVSSAAPKPLARLPLLILSSGETLISYLTRLARCRAGMSLRSFLAFIGLNAADFVAPNSFVLGRIAALSGVEPTQLHEAALHPADVAMRRYRGQAFSKAIHLERMVFFWPLCLIEECADLQSDADIIDLLDGTLHPSRDLETLADAARQRAPTTLQRHIQERFEDLQSVEHLDLHRVDQIAASATLRGTCLHCGSGARQTKLSEDELGTVGAAGFHLLMEGEAGVIGGFDQILRQNQKWRAEKSVATAYRALFRHVSRDPDLYTPLRPLLRRHILDNMAIAARTDLFSVSVDARRKPTAHSLDRQAAASPKRLMQLLMHPRLLVPEDRGKPFHQQVFDAVQGETITHPLKNAVPMKAVRDHLHCDTTTAAALVSNGHLIPIGGHYHTKPHRPHTLDLIEITSIDQFLNTLSALITLPFEALDRPLDMTEAVYRCH
jgi:hypothetical protein